MSELTAFLLARIAEDEAASPLKHGNLCRSFTYPYPDNFDPGDCDCGADDRWAAECEAKRRIVELHGATQHPLSLAPSTPTIPNSSPNGA